LRLRVYLPDNAASDKRLTSKYHNVSMLSVRKARHASYHIYVNCRSLLREFFKAKRNLANIHEDFIIPYLAGRFDGDGSVAKGAKKYFRIVYGSREEAAQDKTLLERIRPYKISIYHYRSAKTHCLYISQKDAGSLTDELKPYLSNLQKIAAHTP
jgi:hypothetical protein